MSSVSPSPPGAFLGLMDRKTVSSSVPVNDAGGVAVLDEVLASRAQPQGERDRPVVRQRSKAVVHSPVRGGGQQARGARSHIDDAGARLAVPLRKECGLVPRVQHLETQLREQLGYGQAPRVLLRTTPPVALGVHVPRHQHSLDPHLLHDPLHSGQILVKI